MNNIHDVNFKVLMLILSYNVNLRNILYLKHMQEISFQEAVYTDIYKFLYSFSDFDHFSASIFKYVCVKKLILLFKIYYSLSQDSLKSLWQILNHESYFIILLSYDRVIFILNISCRI